MRERHNFSKLPAVRGEQGRLGGEQSNPPRIV